MKVNIVAVGKLKEHYLMDGISEYAKRLKPFLKLTIIEVAESKAPERLSQKEQEQVLEQEGSRILSQLNDTQYVIVLAISGEMISSEQFAEKLDQLLIQGRSEITFVIGGSLGLSDVVYQRADYLISFSRFTYPHQLMRLILIEQIYRAHKINRGEPYHK
jgi:23S rRNA (pseudouridine1915-N3)-methyltransferase